jgi:D-alanyl-D-alanine carboxypeptidase/D-alanyl-D-alanine-endopeptidase (penicillin-binding protein 4)
MMYGAPTPARFCGSEDGVTQLQADGSRAYASFGRPGRGVAAALALAFALVALPAAGDAPRQAPLPAARPAVAAAPATTPASAFAQARPPLAKTHGGTQSASLVAISRASRAAATAASPAATSADADAVVRQTALTGHVGFAVVDMATGEVLDSFFADRPFPPASTAKAVTALYALETLGADKRFVTELRAAGPIQGGALRGALALVGGGDPDLDSDDLADLLKQAADAGLRRADGALIADGAALPAIARIDPEQPEQAAYNPAVGGLNLNYNRALFEWRNGAGGPALSVRATGTRVNPAVTAVTVALAAHGGPVLTRRDDPTGTELWEVAPDALVRDGQRWLPVRRPDVYAGDALRALGPVYGVALPAPRAGRAPDGMQVIARHESPVLSEIVRGMLRWSTNLTAEALGMTATQTAGKTPQDLHASAERMGQWMLRRAGLSGSDAAGLRLMNHSGLDAESRVTPAQMSRFLRAAAIDQAAPVRASNPGGLVTLAPAAPATRVIGDDRGALAALMRPVPLGSGKDAPPKRVEAVAKTGTLLYVRGLAGYLNAASGRRLAFAIYAEDLDRRAALTDFESDRGASRWGNRARAQELRLLNLWARRF